MQLFVAVLCADKDFGESEFGLWIFKVGGSCQKPGENRFVLSRGNIQRAAVVEVI